MSKSKRKKTENRKVKIKLGKKLPKNVNEVKGTFKTAKIILRQQYNQDLSTSDKIAEILARVKNKNNKQKNQAMLNLDHFLTTFTGFNDPSIIPHVNQIIEATFPAIFDEDATVRRNFRKTLTTLIKKINLLPISEKIDNFLECSLSHVSQSIQFDTLHVFEIILSHSPYGTKFNVKIFKLLIRLAKIGGSIVILDNLKLKNTISIISRYIKNFINKSDSEDRNYYCTGTHSLSKKDESSSIDAAFSEFMDILSQIWQQKCPDKHVDEIDIGSDYAQFLAQIFDVVDLMIDFDLCGLKENSFGQNVLHLSSKVWVQNFFKGIVKRLEFPFKSLTCDKTAFRNITLLNLHICRFVAYSKGFDNSYVTEYLLSVWSGGTHVLDDSQMLVLLNTSWLFSTAELIDAIIHLVFDFKMLSSPRHRELVLLACDLFNPRNQPCTYSFVDIIPPLLPLMDDGIDSLVVDKILKFAVDCLSISADSFSPRISSVIIKMIDDGKLSSILTKINSKSADLFLFLLIALNLGDLRAVLSYFVRIYYLFTPTQLSFFLTSTYERIYLSAYVAGYYSLLLTLLLGVSLSFLGSYTCELLKEKLNKAKEWRIVVINCIESLPRSEEFKECCISKIKGLHTDLPLTVDSEIVDILVNGLEGDHIVVK